MNSEFKIFKSKLEVEYVQEIKNYGKIIFPFFKNVIIKTKNPKKIRKTFI